MRVFYVLSCMVEVPGKAEIFFRIAGEGRNH